MGTSAVVEKAREVGEVVVPKVREARDAVGSRAGEIAAVVGPKLGELGTQVAPKLRTARRKVGFWIAGEEPRRSRRWPAFAAAGIGAVAAFFLDPVSGKRRRSVTWQWIGGRIRAGGRGASRLGRAAGARASGYARRITSSGSESPPENDATLAHKVESELFQGLGIPSGQINVNAENGVVVLRGAMSRPSEIVDVERRVWSIGGVRGVENLLHLEGTPAPTG